MISGTLLNPSSIFEAGALSQTQSLSTWLLWIACPKDALFQHSSLPKLESMQAADHTHLAFMWALEIQTPDLPLV